MRERIDISEVEAQTKIRAKYLRAIENEEWELLPGAVYAKSFLRTYGDYLGLDSRMLVDEFRRRYEGLSEHDIRPVASRPPRERDRRPRRRAAPAWTPIAAVVVVVLAVLFAVGELFPGSSSTNTNAQRTGAHHRHHPAHSVLPKTTTRTLPPPTRVTLRMVPTAPVYVCLVRGDGSKLIYEQTYNPGETIPTETGSKLLLTLGNNSVRLTVNGKLIPIAASASAIRLLITAPARVQPIPVSQPPTCP